MASSFLRFLDHTERRTTVGRTPLDEWSARRRDLYLTTHNTHNRQTSMPPVEFEPTISAGERPQTYALDRAVTATLPLILTSYFCVRKPTKCTNFSKVFLEWNSTFFRTIPLSIIKSFSLYTQQWYMSYRFADSSASRIRMFHPDPARKQSANLYDIYHCRLYSENSWWWTEELSATCRVSFQNKFEKVMHLVGLLQEI